ncbi:polymorphic toxin-type HINT domain-containing protein [Micromonospora sp. NPDC005215]|uniref:polymorphic toxin-type HINT domain-containing protein n=1 Tax=Micromonospora sp. NPDC005215 TaxID=3157024 RepID=UPI00339F5B87
MRVQLIDRTKLPSEWRDGLMLRLDQPAALTQRGRVNVTVDYSSFANAYGADWSTRLQLSLVPDCVLTGSTEGDCRVRPLNTHNDVAANRVSADVDLAPAAGTGASTLVAVTAAASGTTGDYSATPLQASSTWSAGGSSGNFTWSYPMRTPPSLGGPAPTLDLSYNSAAVDGRSDASNNQPSWVGEGFELWPGMIERKYKPCNEDKGTGANNTTDTYDLCWGTDNAIMSLNGSSTELIRDDATGTWRAKNENGTRIERRTDTVNGDNDNEYWKVTTSDGTQYFFGLNRLSGWTTDKPTTKSTWTVPVAGNNTNEHCHKSSFVDSFCSQAWRWNLDYVVDLRGNTMSMWYTPQTNKYGRNMTDSDAVTYDRGGVLNRIDYGTDRRSGTDTAYTATSAPMRVVFNTANRCLTDCTNTENWKDTPKDKDCTGTSCDDHTPTFWSTSRLTNITTEVWNPTSTPAGYRPVDSWRLNHDFPPNGDASRDGMWLESIANTGHVIPPDALPGTTAHELPEINFDFVAKPNRVDALGDTKPPMNWMRMGTIWTETGAKISITYSDPECVKDQRMPASPETNTLRCYPVMSEDSYTKETETEYFHKYVVTQVDEADQTGGGTDKTTRYEYPPGGAAWRYSDDDGLTKDKFRTWADYRGYDTVRVHQGVPGKDTLTETKYFRGLHGGKASPGGGTRNVSLPAVDINADGDTADTADAPAAADENAWAGMTRQQTTFNGVDTDPVSTTVTKPWQSAATATRDMGQTTAYARYTGTDTTWSATKLDAGRGWRITKMFNTYGLYGMADYTTNLGDLAVTGDETCVDTSYARNTSINLLTPVARVQTFALPCGQEPTTEAHILGDDRTSYDGHTYYTDGTPGGTPPDKGEATTAETLKAWSPANGGTTSWLVTEQTTYDAYGRTKTTTDVRGNKTSTTPTPLLGGPVTKVDTTQTVGTQTWTSSIEMEPAWGNPTATTDTNLKRTDLEYDTHGRLIRVWLADRPKSTNRTTPSMEYQYTIRNAGGVNAIMSKVLNPDGNYVATYALFDGLLRDRQTQRAALAGTGTIFTEKIYDAAGRVATSTNQHYDETLNPGINLQTIDEWKIKGQTVTEYDRANRVKATIFRTSINKSLTEKWRTTTIYGGDRTYVTPPLGGTATTTITDARNNVTELRQHDGGTPAGAFDATAYRFDGKGQLIELKDPAGNKWTYGYDIRGRQISADDPDRGLTTTAYNDYGDVTETVDATARARGQKLVYAYDDLGRKTGVYDNTISATTKRATWSYDPAGAQGQLASTSRWTGTNRDIEYRIRIRGYSMLYKPTGEDYIIPAVETGLAGTYSFTRTYKADGMTVGTATYPNAGGLGGEELTYGYDSVTGLPETLATNASGIGQYVSETAYTEYGELAAFRLQQASGNYLDRSFVYDDASRRLKQATTARQITPQYVSDLHYDYDDAGNITKISDRPTSGTADNQCFAYDYLRRLTEAWTPVTGDCKAAKTVSTLGGPAPYWSTWTFDPVGSAVAANLKVQETVTPTTTTKRTFEYPSPGSDVDHPHAVGAVTTTGVGSGITRYSYDVAGNMNCRPGPSVSTNTCPTGTGSQSLTWDLEGKLTQLVDGTKQHSYLYGAEGNRLIARDPTGSTLYLPGQEIRYTKATGSKSATRYYSYAGQPVATTKSGSGWTWLITDHQGTQNTAVAAGNQAITKRYQMPYGEPRGSANPVWLTNKGFVGGEIDGAADPTGLTHIGARSYDSSIARFISVDPLQNLGDPLHWQGYSYANNSPITLSDPSGLDPGGGQRCDMNGCNGAPPNIPGGSVDKEKPGHPTGAPGGTTLQDTIKTGKCTSGTSCHSGWYNDRPFARLPEVQQVEVVRLTICANDKVLCDKIQAADDAAGRRMLLQMALELSGVADAKRCLDGSAMGCFWASVSFAGYAKTAAELRLAAKAGRTADEARVAGEIGSSCKSFGGETRVLMADGTAIPIKDVKAGDRVMATEPETGEQGPREVSHVWVHDDDLVNLVLSGGDSIATTADHPFWNHSDQRWDDAEDLDQGDVLHSTSGAPVTVVGLKAGSGHRDPAYNLTVSGLHTYYVFAGDSPVLVHNVGPVGACPVDGTPHGQLGELASAQRLTAEGYTSVHSQVRFKNSNGDVFIADFVARGPNGEWVAVEAKTGAGATISFNQQVGYPELESTGAVLDTSKMEGVGIPQGTRVTMEVEFDLWECPICGSKP